MKILKFLGIQPTYILYNLYNIDLIFQLKGKMVKFLSRGMNPLMGATSQEIHYQCRDVQSHRSRGQTRSS